MNDEALWGMDSGQPCRVARGAKLTQWKKKQKKNKKKEEKKEKKQKEGKKEKEEIEALKAECSGKYDTGETIFT
ncbi:hypothetical protein BZA05DRAFT_440632 [Tricharina praecox]|uniref:uncharacterized protein n=1 Tax=Tricharina praecox TaxID=43433 RepID=UPI0022201669|nr:uncharacterized protein BZA05DRAFT_440632 [Tricharina praecox]KAI5859027.1 hypothetical protein BZA05DRAFT_440632 [Tricharina praecox]